jgi:hypothetical protein
MFSVFGTVGTVGKKTVLLRDAVLWPVLPFFLVPFTSLGRKQHCALYKAYFMHISCTGL